ncbi:hypothetical protein [Nostoc sp. CALU 546]
MAATYLLSNISPAVSKVAKNHFILTVTGADFSRDVESQKRSHAVRLIA